VTEHSVSSLVGTLVFFLSRRCRRYIHAEFVTRSGSHEFTVCRSSAAGFEGGGRRESGPCQNSPHGYRTYDCQWGAEPIAPANTGRSSRGASGIIGPARLRSSFGCNMKAKRRLFLASVLLLIAVGLAVLFLRPREYYRFHAGRVYLVTNPQMLFNSLRPPPCLQFDVPRWARAASWKPSADQVRRELAAGSTQLSPQEVEEVVHSCVSYNEWNAIAERSGAANRGQPVRSETNRTSAAAGPGR